MGRKSFGICVLLLALLLGASSAAYADTISITSVSLSNLQIVPTSGTIVFSAPSVGSRTAASGAAENGFGKESGNRQEDPALSQASTSVTFATAGGVSNFSNLFLNANANVTLPGCVCSGETEGLAFLRESFIITGGSGNVDVSFTGLLQALQNVITDEFSCFLCPRPASACR